MYFIENEQDGLDRETIRQALKQPLEQCKNLKKVLLIPPDITRSNSGAGLITSLYYQMLTDEGIHVDILPALGTHTPMTRAEQLRFFGDIPAGHFLVHRWRNGVTTLGEIPKDFVRELSEGQMDWPIPVQISDHLLDKSYDLILSIGQVVPHETAGMANYTKNIAVGCGGRHFINSSHILSAYHGIERTMGNIDTPVRKLFDYAETHFLSKLPLSYILTVTVTEAERTDIIGLYIGGGKEGREAFLRASDLSQKRNIITVERPIHTCVTWLDKHEFHSAWLGNKAVYRTRMAMADGGRLVIMAPGVKNFGEDPEIDRLIRKYGYTGRESILALCKIEADLKNNLSAASHIVHSSSEGRFDIVYAAPLLSKKEVEGVGYQYMDFEEATERYSPDDLRPGFNKTATGEAVYFVPNPALGLWRTTTR